MLEELLFDYTLQTVTLGSAVLGVVSGVLGSFAVLRKQSLLGDAISHAALPGVVLAYLLTHSKAPLVLLLGAALAGWLGTLLVMSIVRSTRLKYDTALGIVLSVFFGFGLVLLTFLQKRPDAAQAGLDNFLFGQAAALVRSDVVTMTALAAIALAVTLLFWKEFKLLSFDPDFGCSLGFRMSLVDVLLTSLLVIAIVLGLQMVGVVLMSAMVVAPGAAARQWTDRLGLMVLLAASFGAAAGVSGAVASSTATRLPTGPSIVLAIGVIVVVSILLAPNRGLAWEAVREARNRRRLQLGVALTDLYALASRHPDLDHGHSIEALRAMNPQRAAVRPSLEALEEQGWARRVGEDEWALTLAGRREAERRLAREE